MRRTDRLSRMRKIKPSLCLISQVQALSTPDLPGSDRVGVHGAPGARVDPRTGALLHLRFPRGVDDHDGELEVRRALKRAAVRGDRGYGR